MTDMIDRQELIAHLNECIVSHEIAHSPLIDAVLTAVKCAVEQMPTVEPKRGEWIAHKGAHGKNYTTCSNCNSEIALKLKNGSIERLDMTYTNFCPNCGADMRGKNV